MNKQTHKLPGIVTSIISVALFSTSSNINAETINATLQQAPGTGGGFSWYNECLYAPYTMYPSMELAAQADPDWENARNNVCGATGSLVLYQIIKINDDLYRSYAHWTGYCSQFGDTTCYVRRNTSVQCHPGYIYANGVCNTYKCPSTGGWTLTGSICTRPDCNPETETRDELTGQCTDVSGNRDNGRSCPATNKPIAFGSGNKWLIESDVKSANTLRFVRTYNSNPKTLGNIALGSRWRNTFSQRLDLGATDGSIWVFRPDGKAYRYVLSGGSYAPDADIADRLYRETNTSGVTTGYRLETADNTVERYDPAGKLLSIADPAGLLQTLAYNTQGRLIAVTDGMGRSLGIAYDASNRIATVADPAGGMIAYGYDANNNLATVTYPGGAVRQYHYEHATLKNALTGITDERGVRYITYSYDASGKAIGETLNGGVESYSLNFGSNSTTVTDPLGTQRTYNFQTILGVVKNTGVSQPGGSGCGPAAEGMTYDANGNVASRTDFNGRKTTYGYDLSRNLETTRTEGLDAAGAALSETRTTTTAWHATWRLPVQIDEYAGATAAGNPVRRTQIGYDDKGNVTSRSITDVAAGVTRTWTTATTYSVAVPGLVLQKVEDGPRTDVADTVTTDYYPHDEVCAGASLGTGRDKGCRGQIKRLTDALGQVTQFTRYNAHGQVEEIVDPNGVTTTLTYDLRQRLTSRSTAGETTGYQYDPVGQLTKLTLPDGSYLSYTYDGARRLTAIADSLGNSIAYTLDAAGNRTKEEIRDPQGALVKTLTRAYDALGRLQTLTGVAAE